MTCLYYLNFYGDKIFGRRSSQKQFDSLIVSLRWAMTVCWVKNHKNFKLLFIHQNDFSHIVPLIPVLTIVKLYRQMILHNNLVFFIFGCYIPIILSCPTLMLVCYLWYIGGKWWYSGSYMTIIQLQFQTKIWVIWSEYFVPQTMGPSPVILGFCWTLNVQWRRNPLPGNFSNSDRHVISSLDSLSSENSSLCRTFETSLHLLYCFAVKVNDWYFGAQLADRSATIALVSGTNHYHLKWKRLSVDVPSRDVPSLSVYLPKSCQMTERRHAVTSWRHTVTSNCAIFQDKMDLWNLHRSHH